MSAPQDLLEGQVAIGADDSLQWYDGTSWHSQAPNNAVGRTPLDPVDSELAIGSDHGFYWYSNGAWRGAGGVECTGNPPQDSIEGQIALGNDGIFCWQRSGVWYTFGGVPVGTGLLADRSARIFVPDVAGAGDTSLPGYSASWSYNPATNVSTVTFNSVNTIDYVIEARGAPGAGGIVTGDGSLISLSNVLESFAYPGTVYAIAAWLFSQRIFPPDAYDPNRGYYATDVLEVATGAPLAFAATWDYDGDKTISVTFTSDDDGTNPWYLSAGSPYLSGTNYYTRSAVEYSTDGPFSLGTIVTMTLVLSQKPEEIGFNATLGTIPPGLT